MFIFKLYFAISRNTFSLHKLTVSVALYIIDVHNSLWSLLLT